MKLARGPKRRGSNVPKKDVTRNWRITFRIDPTRHEIVDLDYVDYH